MCYQTTFGLWLYFVNPKLFYNFVQVEEGANQGILITIYNGQIIINMSRLHIDNLDTKILQMLVDNGRKPFLEIARECGVSGAAIHQRIAKLQATNILEGSRALIKPTTLGYDTCAFVGVFLRDPENFDDVVEKLKGVPEITECHFTTGQYDMLIKMYARDNEHLLHLIHERIQPLGILRTETLVSFREVFSRALPVAPKK